MTLGILLFTVTLWVSRAIPLSVAALLSVALLSVAGPSGSFSDAARGFAMDTIFFLLAANLMAQAVANAGLMDRLARSAGRMTGGDPGRALWLFTGLTGASALLMPSALVRAKAFLPLARALDETFAHRGLRGRFLKTAALIMALLGPAGSISVMTGGGMSIVAARTIGEFYRPLNWLQWLVAMAPPAAAVIVAVSLIIRALYAPGSGWAGAPAPIPSGAGSGQAAGPQQPARPWSAREKIALAVLGAALAAWMAGTRWHVPLALPAIFAAGALALPPVGLVGPETIQQQRWDEILVVGSALSLSAALRDTGAINWVAERAFALFPDHPGPVGVYGLTLLLGVLLRQLFLQPAPCLAITLPIVIEMARVTGTDPMVVALLASGTIGVVQVLPVQSPPSLLYFSDGVFDVRDELRVAPFLVTVTAAVMLLAALAYWPLLRLVGWV